MHMLHFRLAAVDGSALVSFLESGFTFISTVRATEGTRIKGPILGTGIDLAINQSIPPQKDTDLITENSQPNCYLVRGLIPFRRELDIFLRFESI